jgi:hypothetical protein
MRPILTYGQRGASLILAPYDGKATCITARCLVHGSPARLSSLLVYRDAGGFSFGFGLPTPDKLVNRIVRRSIRADLVMDHFPPVARPRSQMFIHLIAPLCRFGTPRHDYIAVLQLGHYSPISPATNARSSNTAQQVSISATCGGSFSLSLAASSACGMRGIVAGRRACKQPQIALRLHGVQV